MFGLSSHAVSRTLMRAMEECQDRGRLKGGQRACCSWPAYQKACKGVKQQAVGHAGGHSSYG